LVIYPPDREAQVLSLIGRDADVTQNYRDAAQRAVEEISTSQDRDLFFAWFNLGSSLVGVQDFAGAAKAYDQAFALYPGLAEKDRPYRLMWYQIGPYQAYYQTGRYQDVLNLANTTLAWVSAPVLEESYYWRGMAYEALGQQNQAVADFQKSARINPNYAAPRDELQRLGLPIS
jgi:tetratricopeptide (TPR) repeat protein